MRAWVPVEVHDRGGAGYWPCPRLAPRRLTGIRLRRLSDQGALVLSRKEAGLITDTCGLGGPHYARKQQQPHSRSPPSPPTPLLRPAGEGVPRFYFLRGDLCWKRGESTLCETAQQPVLLQDPLPVAACRVERLDPRSDVVPMVVVGPTRKHVLVDHAWLIDIDPAADL